MSALMAVLRGIFLCYCQGMPPKPGKNATGRMEKGRHDSFCCLERIINRAELAKVPTVTGKSTCQAM